MTRPILQATVLGMVLWAVPAAAGTITVPAGGHLQAALDAAMPGDTILLAPDGLYVGNFVVRRGVTIRTDGPLPEGRMTPEWSGRLAVLRSPNNMPALATGPNVSHLRVVGIEIAPNGHTGGTSIAIGSNTETDETRQPVHVVLDRLLVRGDPVNGQKRGLSLHGSHITVLRSHVSDFKLVGQDTQAIWINNGWGPYTIVDNYLEASGENILTGGDTPRIDQLVPADIRIERNTIAKPFSWKQEGWTVKNLIELKSARRVVIRGNWIEGSWVSGQVGYGILLTPKDQYGKAPWTTIEDVLVELNVIHEISEGIRVLGDDHAYPSVRARDFVFRHNLIVADRVAHGGSGRCLVVGRAPQAVEFSANTCISNGQAFIYTYYGGSVREIQDGVFRGNVLLHNQYGFSAESFTSGGIGALTLHYPGGVLEGNLIGGASASRYPFDHVLPVAEFQAQFEDYAGGHFRLTAAARARFADADGRVPGADLDAIAAALAGVDLPPDPNDPPPGQNPPAPNQPPVAHDQQAAAVSGQPLAIVLTGADPDGDPLTFAVAAPPVHGTLAGTPPHVTYTPAADFGGTDVFTFTVSDGRGGIATGQVTVHVTLANRAPVATSQSVSAMAGVPVSLLLSATDPDGDPLTFVVVSGPTHGWLTGTAPHLTYTAPPGYAGPDAFTFAVHDGRGGTATGLVTVTVSAPLLEIATTSLPDGRASWSYEARLEAGDATPCAWTRTGGSLPPGLTLSAAGVISGTPSAVGTFTFTVRASDAAGRSAERLLSIQVSPAPGNSGSAPGRNR